MFSTKPPPNWLAYCGYELITCFHILWSNLQAFRDITVTSTRFSLCNKTASHTHLYQIDISTVETKRTMTTHGIWRSGGSKGNLLLESSECKEHMPPSLFISLVTMLITMPVNTRTNNSIIIILIMFDNLIEQLWWYFMISSFPYSFIYSMLEQSPFSIHHHIHANMLRKTILTSGLYHYDSMWRFV